MKRDAMRNLLCACMTFVMCLVAAQGARAQEAPQATQAAPSAPAAETAAAPSAVAAGAPATKPFPEAVDLTPLATLAVQADGRLKSLSSFTAEMMS